MQIDKVIHALNSDTRRKILKILSDGPKNTSEVYSELSKIGAGPKYRESVYRSLEILVDSGLVQKIYHPDKGICYDFSVVKIEIDLSSGTISKTCLRSR